MDNRFTFGSLVLLALMYAHAVCLHANFEALDTRIQHVPKSIQVRMFVPTIMLGERYSSRLCG